MTGLTLRRLTGRATATAALLLSVAAPVEAQRPVDRFDAAAGRVLEAAHAEENGVACYPGRDSLAIQISRVREVLGPSNAKKVGKDFDGRFARSIIETGGRGQMVNVLRAFQSYARHVATTVPRVCPATASALGLNPTAPDPENWPEFAAWRSWLNSVAQQANTYSLEVFEIRYGGGESLNWAEVFLDNTFQRMGLAGATDFRPSHLEPILRLTPLVYYAATEEMISVGEVGLNYYAFGGPLKAVNPIGLSFVLGNPKARHPLKGLFYAADIEPGVFAHVRKVQVGALRSGDGEWRLISTFNFQVIKGIF